MKLSYVLIGLVVIALLAATFAGGYFVGANGSLATAAYGPGAMMRGGYGMMDGFGRGFGTTRGFLPGFGALGFGFRFLAPLAFLGLIVLVVILLMRKPAAPAVAPVTAAAPSEIKQV